MESVSTCTSKEGMARVRTFYQLLRRLGGTDGLRSDDCGNVMTGERRAARQD